jgi:hypothetical protein
MGALDSSLPALIALAGTIFASVWQGRKTRRVNTDEHTARDALTRQAADSADRAATAAERAARSSARTEGRLAQYIEDHTKVHANLPRS